MKKKQLLVFIMAGSLAAGMSPVTMAFAEADTQTVTIEDIVAVAAESEEGEAAAEPVQDISDAAADTPVEEPAQAADTPTAEPTQAAADTPAAEPTQAAADTPAAEPAQAADAVVDDGFNSGDTAELTLEEEESATPTPETTGQIILKAADGTQTSYSTLAEAIAAAPVNIGKDGEVTQILVTGTVEISETVVIDQNKNISIAAAADGTTIKRAAGFLGDMFKVKDESTSFQFGTGKEGETVLSLTVTGALDQGDATGSIISVEGGYFGLSDGVTLTGNRTSAPGAAICNSGGSIGLAGGTITGNQSEGIVNEAAEITGGAIYSLGEIRVSGAVIVKDNKDDGLNDNSIVLGGDNACIAAIGQLAETADLQVRRSDAAAGKIIVKVGTDANGTALTTMENILAHVHYLDTTEYTINNQTGALESVTAPVSTMTLTADSISWNKAYEHTVDLTFHTNDAGVGGRYYVTWVKKSDSTPGFEAVKSNYKSSGDIASSASVQLTDVAYDTAIKVVVYAEDSKGLEAVAPLVLTLKAKASTPTETPVTTTPTPTTRATINPSVSESKVTGLEKALEFYPKQMYNFTVTGAGTDNTNPVKGDTKWIPYGWSMSAKNIDTGYQKSWSIGNVNGIKQAKTFRMYIFFQKYIYNGSEWEATGVKEALPTEFKSKAIDFTVTPSGTITPTATAGSGSGSGGYDYDGSGSGDGTDGDDAENHDGTDSDTGSSSATNARTADNSPIATMMMLASLSLVAGGYVIIRKRKKEI
ncbi:hypothetical protein RO865_05955 [Blautia faecis]|uniref:hypothetical protein n=1 Tax=Blautia faecis TaxID=871665 RepID=UPI0028A5221F|nr:hypothetical protein [Blautia faecis]MDT4368364.1 hypothetical protein [Blautia faecis]